MKQEPFDWDDHKAESNFKKHGISFEEASTVLRNTLAAEFFDDQHSVSEERWIAIGHSNFGRVLIVCYVETGTKLRIISAREADKQEIKTYEEKRSKST